MSDLPEQNYPAFTAAAEAIRRLGLNVVSPHESTALPQEEPTPGDWRRFLRKDLVLLVDCQGIILLPGWNRSRGARLELSVALALEMPVVMWTGSHLIDCGEGVCV